MKFLGLIFLFLIFVSSSSLANTMLIISSGSPSGTNGQQANLFAKTLESENIKTEIKLSNQNCALSKLHWDTSKQPTLMMINHGADGLTDKDNSVCFMNIKNDQIIFWIYSTPYTFCSAQNKTWNDFVKSGSEHTIVIPTENRIVYFLEKLSKNYNIKIKTIKVLNSSAALSMAKSEEVDFVFRTGISEFDHFKNRCIWSTIRTLTLPGIEDFILFDDLNEYRFTTDTYIIAKNLDKMKILPLLKKTWNLDEMKKIHEKRGYDNSLVDYTTEEEYIIRMNSLFLKLK